MKFTELLTLENIRQGLICSSKKHVFEVIGRIIAPELEDQELDCECCFHSLFSREKLGNSGLGNGIAMPKGRLIDGDSPIAVFLQLSNPVDYDAADKREVDLVFALLIPSEVCTTFSQSVLPQLAEKLTDKTLCKQLRAAQSAEEIWQIFEYADLHNQSEEETEVKNEKEEALEQSEEITELKLTE